MNSNDSLSRRIWLAGSLAAALAVGAGGLNTPAMAHETHCPYCRLDVVQDTDQQDNEVALRYGRKRIEYRCVLCALAQAKSDFKGDVTVLAPSEFKGKPVVISRKDEKWMVSPVTAVFVAEKVSHQSCHIGYRAFSSREAFNAYVKQHSDLLKEAKPLTLGEMVELAR